MKKIILAAMSAGILSGCSSAPPLATPKGEFVDMNTDITSLLPPSEPVYTGGKIANITSPSLVTIGTKAGVKSVQVNGKKEADKKEIDKKEAINHGLLLSVKTKDKAVPDKTVLKQTPVPLKGFITPVVTVAPKLASSAATKDNSHLATNSRNPFSSSPSVKPLSTEAVKSAVPVAPLKTAPAMKVWQIKKGTTLITGFSEWIDKEKCPSGDGKWKLQRLTDTDYPIDYPLTFTGKDLEDVTSQLFNLYRRTQAPLYVSGYRNQCLIVISDKK